MKRLLTAIVLSTAVSGAHASLFFSQDNNGNGLFQIDTTTGAATLLGSTGVGSSTVGLAPSADPNVLFGSEPFELLRINADGSGATNLGGATSEGLAYDADSDTLYGQLNGDFFTLDQNTGAILTNLASAPGDPDGLAFGRGGVFGLDDSADRLLFYDVGTDVWSIIGSIGVAVNDPGLAYDPNADLLYAIGGSDLLSIDPDSGVATVIGPTGLGPAGGGLAFVTARVPTPMTSALLGLGLLGLGLSRRRQR